MTNQSADSVTEISATTLQAAYVLVDTTNLPSVGPITFGDGYVFTSIISSLPPGRHCADLEITVASDGGMDDVQHQRAL